jgi:hypothetical protein
MTPTGYVIGRDGNVIRVDFRRNPDPPAPRFPGAAALRDIDVSPPQPHPASVAWAKARTSRAPRQTVQHRV